MYFNDHIGMQWADAAKEAFIEIEDDPASGARRTLQGKWTAGAGLKAYSA